MTGGHLSSAVVVFKNVYFLVFLLITKTNNRFNNTNLYNNCLTLKQRRSGNQDDSLAGIFVSYTTYICMTVKNPAYSRPVLFRNCQHQHHITFEPGSQEFAIILIAEIGFQVF